MANAPRGDSREPLLAGVSAVDGLATTSVYVDPTTHRLYVDANIKASSIFKGATATASGDTAVWTPASGKKFRLLKYMIQITNDAAQSAGGVIDVVLRDSASALAFGLSIYVPGAAGTTVGLTGVGWVDIGGAGYLSTAANNVLNVNLSAALTSGKVRVLAIGTEE